MSNDGIGRAIERVGQAAMWLFAVCAVIIVYEVIARYGFAAPTSWTNVTATACCAIGFALGGAYCMVRGEHIRITALYDRFVPRGKRLADWIALVCGVIYLVGLGYAAIREAADSVWRFEEGRWAPEPTPGPPNWPVPALIRVMLAVGAVLFLIAVLRAVVKTLRTRAD
jgi:C4-dicarboxylate transporter, DctQ subunit